MNKKGIIGIIVIIVIIAIAVVAIFLNNNNKMTNDLNQSKQRNEIDQGEVANSNNQNETPESANQNEKVLIAYFSLPETTGDAKEDSTVTINGERLGNTQYVANLIQEHTKAEVFRIEAVKNYNTSNHSELIAEARQEQEENARPEIKETISNFNDYDTIFIGYPIWWSDLPQILYTFLESYDFSGKNVYLFSTNGGSGLSGTVNTITNKLSSAKVNKNAFRLNRDNMEDAPKEVEAWLQNLGINES